MLANRRVRKGGTDTITAAFYGGGETAATRGSVTVTVTSDTGATLATGSASEDGSTHVYSYSLTTAATAAIDLLTVTWASASETITTHVEVVGGFYFDLADLRAMNDISGQTTKYPTDSLRRARDWIEDIIDGTVNAPFVRRYFRDQFNWTPNLVLRQPYGRALLSMSVNGTAVSGGDLAALTIDSSGRIVTAATGVQSYRTGLVDIRYEAAVMDSCPADLREVALQAARWHLIATDGQSGIPSRATSITNEFGNVNLTTASKDRPTGIPDVDAVILNYAKQYRIPGIG